jgi:histidine triad (HIT) family protein
VADTAKRAAAKPGDDEAAEIVCEDKDWVAFFPPEPATPGHTLVVPRFHVANLWEAEPPLGATLIEAVGRVGRAIQTALQPEGMNLITSAGTAAEQSVFHLHLHLVPRWKRDKFGQIWPIEGEKYEDDQLNDAADRIRAACRTAGDEQ